MNPVFDIIMATITYAICLYGSWYFYQLKSSTISNIKRLLLSLVLLIVGVAAIFLFIKAVIEQGKQNRQWPITQCERASKVLNKEVILTDRCYVKVADDVYQEYDSGMRGERPLYSETEVRNK